MRLQRTIGNQAVSRLLAGSAGQPEAAAPVVQRKVYLNKSKTPLSLRLVETTTANTGKGSRNVRRMIKEPTKQYFFADEPEMVNYAAERTDNMGYLEKEKQWIRLPDSGLLVLGENHSSTTLKDVVKTTGNRKYLYEPHTEFPAELTRRSKRVRTAYETRRGELAAEAGHEDDRQKIAHEGEKILPKIVIGLVGLRDDVKAAVKAFNQGSKGGSGSGGSGGGYSRKAAELAYLLRAVLVAAKSAKYKIHSEDLWSKNQAALNAAAKELTGGTPLAETSFIGAIAKGKFTFEEFIQSFKDASSAELLRMGSDLEFAAFKTQREDMQAASAPDAPEFERMREFHMYKKIVAVKGSYRLVGMGDVHRLHLEDILSQESGVTVRQINGATGAPSQFPTFVAEQKQLFRV